MDRRIVVLHYTAPSFAGGVEVLIADFLKLAAHFGHAVHLVAGKGSARSLRKAEFTRLPLLDANHVMIRRANEDLIRGARGLQVNRVCDSIYADLCRHLDSGDIIHAHNVATNSFNLPLVIALHRLLCGHGQLQMLAWCYDFPWGPAASREYDFTRYPLSLLVTPWPRTNYIVPSSERKMQLLRMMNVPEQRISVITPYVDIYRVLNVSDHVAGIIEGSGLWEADVNLLYPCRMTRRKNIQLALEVVRCIKDMQYSVRLLITGPHSPHSKHHSGEYRNEILSMIKALRLGDEIILLGDGRITSSSNTSISNSDMSGLYRIVDAILFTSEDEGFGLPMIEAVLNGIPVIASASSVLAHEDRFGVDVFDTRASASQLARKVLKVVQKQSNRKQAMISFAARRAYWEVVTELSASSVARES